MDSKNLRNIFLRQETLFTLKINFQVCFDFIYFQWGLSISALKYLVKRRLLTESINFGCGIWNYQIFRKTLGLAFIVFEAKFSKNNLNFSKMIHLWQFKLFLGSYESSKSRKYNTWIWLILWKIIFQTMCYMLFLEENQKSEIFMEISRLVEYSKHSQFVFWSQEVLYRTLLFLESC